MKNQLFEDLIESIKELPTEILEEMRVNLQDEDTPEITDEWISGATFTNGDKMRKDFEKWFNERISLLARYGEGFAADQLRQREKEYYEVFKASRESLVVELPKEPYIVDSDFTYGVSSTLNSVKESISSQGIGYK